LTPPVPRGKNRFLRMLRLLLALVACALVLPGTAHAAGRSVPQGWLGVAVDGPVSPYEPDEWDRMTRAGVESVRVALRWYELQPYAPGEVPADDAARFELVDGVPTDFTAFDGYVAAAAARGLAVLPVVHNAPAWQAVPPAHFASPPRDPAAFGRFLTTLVGRYGPDGSFWGERPGLRRMPIRAWQIWNEPNIPGFWAVQPFAPSYAAMLRASAAAVRTADPGATVVLAGLTNASWIDLAAIYDAGGRGSFDAVAVHPYTHRVRDVLRVVRLARAEMARRGDGALPVWITELSWPAAVGRAAETYGFEVGTEAEQAQRLRRAVRVLAARRTRLRIGRVVWYTWLSTEQGPGSFDWAGLRRTRGGRRVTMPALAAFRRAARELQGCAKTRRDARRCA
jgi:hypothetical protein